MSLSETLASLIEIFFSKVLRETLGESVWTKCVKSAVGILEKKRRGLGSRGSALLSESRRRWASLSSEMKSTVMKTRSEKRS